MSNANPTYQMRRLCYFFVYVYIPTLVNVKLKNNIVEGPKHFVQMVMLFDYYCLEEEKDRLRPIVQFNGYQVHPECVILRMVASEES